MSLECNPEAPILSPGAKMIAAVPSVDRQGSMLSENVSPKSGVAEFSMTGFDEGTR